MIVAFKTTPRNKSFKIHAAIAFIHTFQQFFEIHHTFQLLFCKKNRHTL